MPKNSIALIPPNGYQNYESTSYKALLWLKYISQKHNIKIQHSRNSKEKRISRYKVDGWHEETGRVSEFHGCVYHGCTKCYTPNTFNPLNNLLMSVTFKKHKVRMQTLKEMVPEIDEIGVCEFDIMVKENNELKSILSEDKSFKPPLNPRKALSGGRTNAIVLHFKGRAGYIDFTSLYPCVQ
jgi:hypothetical protein